MGLWSQRSRHTRRLPWLSRAVPRARRAGAYVIAASMIGGVAAGPLLG
ncbi:hypothetical protein [Streptomyces violarus]|nr:hypothetical protein [Streptomyces violarus]